MHLLNFQSGLFLLSLLYFVLICGLCAAPLAKVYQGLVQGIIIESRNGRNISSFIGIPYAQPPIGKLRFSSPLSAKKWDGIHFANKLGNTCPQLDNGKVVGNEDCLFLNVFTPRMKYNASLVNSTKNISSLPVMVWIHGGGFITESANLDFYGPRYLLDRDIVLVTLNYRLGLLGFLSTGDSVAPGNFGMKDQVLALKWVQQNIQVFGGDKNRVTLFGESAGGASANLHSLSDTSNGLFHQYISQSGNAICLWGYRDKSHFKKDVNYIAKSVRCPTNNSQDLINCLRKTSFHELLENVSNGTDVSWIPTNEVESKDAFLTDSPQNLINKNKMKDYPIMSGTVFDEGLYITTSLYGNSTSESRTSALDRFINVIFNRFLKPEDLPKFRESIENYYFNESVSSENEEKFLEAFTKFASDSLFMYPHAILMEKMSKITKSPIYSYLFNYHGLTSYVEIDYDIKKNLGVTHADDLLYIFSGVYSASASSRDNYVIDLMVDLWTSFATNGKPTSEHLAVYNLWQPYQESRSFFQIGNINNNTNPSVTLEQDYFTDRINFWKKNFAFIQV